MEKRKLAQIPREEATDEMAGLPKELRARILLQQEI